MCVDVLHRPYKTDGGDGRGENQTAKKSRDRKIHGWEVQSAPSVRPGGAPRTHINPSARLQENHPLYVVYLFLPPTALQNRSVLVDPRGRFQSRKAEC